jgi:hypothetical protein
MSSLVTIPPALVLAALVGAAVAADPSAGPATTRDTARPPAVPPSYDVVWPSPSRDALDSMPLSGRRGAGANVWVQDGSIWLYLAHNGAYDEQLRLLKLGCLRLTPTNATLGGAGFTQRLHLPSGAIHIADPDAGDLSARLWFSGELLYVELHSATPLQWAVSFGTWRDRPRENLSLDMGRGRARVSADTVNVDPRGLRWWHANADHAPDLAGRATRQGIDPHAVPDLIARRSFGGALAADAPLAPADPADVRWQAWDGRAWTMNAPPRQTLRLAVRLAAGNQQDPQRWQQEAIAALPDAAIEQARADEAERWAAFWSRSYVVINPAAADDDPGFRVGRNYQLFRYMLACNRDGEFPLLFNGGIFTVDNLAGRITGNNNDELPIAPNGESTPDFRRWMFCGFMSQNQRWLGWPALAGGDADLLQPSLDFYRLRAGVASARARQLGAQGVCYPEPMDLLGLCCVQPRPDGLCGAAHLTYHFSMMLEHAWMGLCASESIGVPIEPDLPWIIGTVRFYDSFYRHQARQRIGRELGDDGKLVLYPANALEYAVGATDPIEVVAGLRRVVEGLLRQPALPHDDRERLLAIQQTIPDLPIGMRDGRRSLLPARSFEKEYNKWEPIEHYAAWPYRLVGVTQPHTLQLARDTWDTIPADRAALCKQDYSWMANVANMAACGWTDAAQQRAIDKLANTRAPQARFPAFFGPGHDWLPDHNWGGAGMVGLQEMLLAPQPDPDGQLFLLPAWPRDWNVSFKLHAPGRTIVEAAVTQGRFTSLHITPAGRRDAVRIADTSPQPPPAD